MHKYLKIFLPIILFILEISCINHPKLMNNEFNTKGSFTLNKNNYKHDIYCKNEPFLIYNFLDFEAAKNPSSTNISKDIGTILYQIQDLPKTLFELDNTLKKLNLFIPKEIIQLIGKYIAKKTDIDRFLVYARIYKPRILFIRILNSRYNQSKLLLTHLIEHLKINPNIKDDKSLGILHFYRETRIDFLKYLLNATCFDPNFIAYNYIRTKDKYIFYGTCLDSIIEGSKYSLYKEDYLYENNFCRFSFIHYLATHKKMKNFNHNNFNKKNYKIITTLDCIYEIILHLKTLRLTSLVVKTLKFWSQLWNIIESKGGTLKKHKSFFLKL